MDWILLALQEMDRSALAEVTHFGPADYLGKSVRFETERPSGCSGEFEEAWDAFGIAVSAAIENGFDPAEMTAGVDILASIYGGDYGAGLLAHAAAYREMLSLAVSLAGCSEEL
ncbi:hypothetical protein [Bradyrhizobium sp. SZCCHNPS2010]|uniref:hypothetical protein n=1 Tax=Bradyrhizobium sp. SZCCHNPS2010 TaxID=3057333 RepID=UPI002916F90E|nr:hypothetical protein [Bradyrhizobium sp. SZCCHNPS2010]